MKYSRYVNRRTVEAFVDIRNKFEQARITWAVFAGAASHVYGSARKITDIDILVKKTDATKADAALGFPINGKETSVDAIDIVFELELESHGKIITFFMDGEMEKRLRVGNLFGLAVPLVPPEDNMILKAILRRGQDKGKFAVQDILDMSRNPFDRDYLRMKIDFYGVEEIVVPLLSQLAII